MFWNFSKSNRRPMISVTNLNDLYVGTINDVNTALGGTASTDKRTRAAIRIFVIEFNGDAMASQAEALAFEVTSIIQNAGTLDRVLVKINSPGGAAHAYGYAASQLSRIKDAGIPLTVSVDKIAASGGYLMACVADHILAAPWAIVGSIGVVSELPNFHRLLKEVGVDYKQYTAGKFKRTISMMGEITDEGEEKYKEDLHDVYSMFRDHVTSNRPSLLRSIDKVSTGEHWQGEKALEMGLIDEIKTSEDYILQRLGDFEFIKIKYIGNRLTLTEKLSRNMATSFATGLIQAVYSVLMNISAANRFLK